MSNTQDFKSKKFSDSVNQILPKLIEIKSNEKEIDDKKKAKGEYFNVLDSLPRKHHEDLHSNFIGYLLDPNESHKLGNIFLNSFLEIISSKVEDKIIESIRLNEPFTLRREFAVQEGRIDLLLESKNLVIIIENKIFAKDQEYQLKRYDDWAKRVGKPYIIIYLTLDGRYSAQNPNINYFPISYKTDIKNWLNVCLKLVEGQYNPTIGIKSYLDILNNKILHEPNGKNVMKIKDLLVTEHVEIVQFLEEFSSAMVLIRDETRTQFFKDVQLFGQNVGIAMTPISYLNEKIVEIPVEDIWKKPYQGFMIKNPVIKTDKPDENIHIIIEQDWNNLFYGLVGIKNSKGKLSPFFHSDSEQANDLFILINPRINKVNRKENNFFAWANFYPDGETHFLSDKLNYSFLKYGDKIASDFVSEIQTYLVALVGK